ncbi:guanylate kinase [Bartonella sp. TP]|uniref:guanylate kinase n=1 Tax=Bartonella sp. TP TaxID=3057550 RepID=UPI0025B126FD|nr:guanylate kinase [Bartonella sp. TP]MDN5249365.1 guanylate kinase [Alphaproteobacteria bacterium]WJW80119.1 guanylate kinase [Bartonella sp. TP]
MIENISAKRQGMLFVLSSPSGAGKSTLARLMRENLALTISISATTRAPRGGEKHGQDYYFFTVQEFKVLIDKGAFIEWAEVHGNYYGSFTKTVLDSINSGQDLLFDIDYCGMLQLQQNMPEHLVSVFILPPSIENLRQRLMNRSEDTAEVIEQRIKNAYKEMEHSDRFDYVLINETLDQTYQQLNAIYEAETLKRKRALWVVDFLDKLKVKSAG